MAPQQKPAYSHEPDQSAPPPAAPPPAAQSIFSDPSSGFWSKPEDEQIKMVGQLLPAFAGADPKVQKAVLAQRRVKAQQAKVIGQDGKYLTPAPPAGHDSGARQSMKGPTLSGYPAVGEFLRKPVEAVAGAATEYTLGLPAYAISDPKKRAEVKDFTRGLGKGLGGTAIDMTTPDNLMLMGLFKGAGVAAQRFPRVAAAAQALAAGTFFAASLGDLPREFDGFTKAWTGGKFEEAGEAFSRGAADLFLAVKSGKEFKNAKSRYKGAPKPGSPVAATTAAEVEAEIGRLQETQNAAKPGSKEHAEAEKKIANLMKDHAVDKAPAPSVESHSTVQVGGKDRPVTERQNPDLVSQIRELRGGDPKTPPPPTPSTPAAPPVAAETPAAQPATAPASKAPWTPDTTPGPDGALKLSLADSIKEAEKLDPAALSTAIQTFTGSAGDTAGKMLADAQGKPAELTNLRKYLDSVKAQSAAMGKVLASKSQATPPPPVPAAVAPPPTAPPAAAAPTTPPPPTAGNTGKLAAALAAKGGPPKPVPAAAAPVTPPTPAAPKTPPPPTAAPRPVLKPPMAAARPPVDAPKTPPPPTAEAAPETHGIPHGLAAQAAQIIETGKKSKDIVGLKMVINGKEVIVDPHTHTPEQVARMIADAKGGKDAGFVQIETIYNPSYKGARFMGKWGKNFD